MSFKYPKNIDKLSSSTLKLAIKSFTDKIPWYILFNFSYSGISKKPGIFCLTITFTSLSSILSRVWSAEVVSRVPFSGTNPSPKVVLPKDIIFSFPAPLRASRSFPPSVEDISPVFP